MFTCHMLSLKMENPLNEPVNKYVSNLLPKKTEGFFSGVGGDHEHFIQSMVETKTELKGKVNIG